MGLVLGNDHHTSEVLVTSISRLQLSTFVQLSILPSLFSSHRCLSRGICRRNSRGASMHDSTHSVGLIPRHTIDSSLHECNRLKDRIGPLTDLDKSSSLAIVSATCPASSSAFTARHLNFLGFQATDIVCIFDTRSVQISPAPGDLLIHAGDLTQCDTFSDIQTQLT